MMSEKYSSPLLILADDLTGALDSGVQLTRKGMRVVVHTDGCDIRAEKDSANDVIVINTETRHLSSEEAYDIVFRLVREACQCGIDRIYKKTDSGLRGNVGAELAAALAASGSGHLNFIPAYPQMERITRNGIHYVDGAPLSESIFAHDPLDPVTESRIADLIHRQSKISVTSGCDAVPKGVVVYDAETNADMRRIAEALQAKSDLRLSAGCAGFLEVYPVEGTTASPLDIPELSAKLIVLSGSVNTVTRQQLDYAEGMGRPRWHIPLKRAFAGQWSTEEKRTFIQNIWEACTDQNPLILVDTLGPCDEIEAEPSPQTVSQPARHMGSLASLVAEQGYPCTLMIIGGDTLQSFIRERNIRELCPVGEIAPGIVLASYPDKDTASYLITKSGGFGKKDQLEHVWRWLQRKQL
ncbi:four-carbon acid sugar kinase family protein [Hominifimenecus sp. rT4P-3]|uniref:four-carbon acid sugar kinase family protein n=1 Tax=Hominifimenecus sp. rT4P-3 TaxID=3242979 RepID=UPI003DA2E357